MQHRQEAASAGLFQVLIYTVSIYSTTGYARLYCSTVTKGYARLPSYFVKRGFGSRKSQGFWTALFPLLSVTYIVLHYSGS